MKKRALFFLTFIVSVFFVFWYLSGQKTISNSTEEQTVNSNNSISSQGSNSKIEYAGKNETNIPLKVPTGYNLSIFSSGLGEPRVIEFDPDQTPIVSITSRGTILTLPDKKIVASGLNKPHGIAINCEDSECKLYVGETDKVSVFDYDKKSKTASNKQVLFELPAAGGHFTRSLLIVDDQLYTSIGSSCNACNEQDERRAKVLISNLDGTELHQFARGLRNSVFMTVHPQTEQIWATEMGRDLLGDDTPPDEINILEEDNHYGWPNCYGKNIHDTSFDKNTYIRAACSSPYETPSHIDIQAHSAPLGLAFLDSTHLLVSYHGSWNRTIPTGYKIVQMTLDSKGELEKIEDFITGFIDGRTVVGRPVDIKFDKLGTGFITDDKKGVVYKLTKQK